MFGISVPSDVDEETKALGIPRVHTTGGSPDYFIDKDGVQLIHASIKCPFYDAPSAVANPGLSARFDDVPGMWYSDGVRWRPFGGRIALKAVYYNDVAATRSLSVTSQFKVRIPYSLLNGSLFRDGDQIKIQACYQRLYLHGDDSTKIIHRSIYAGSNSSIPANNTLIHETNTSATNDGVPEHEFCFRRMDSTTVQVIGAPSFVFNMFNGPSPNDLATPMGVSDIANMDINDTYIDWCLRWAGATAPTYDAGVLYNGLIEFVAVGA